MKPILVTGASGNVGSALVDVLRAGALPFRVTVSGAQKLKDHPGAVVLDFEKPDTFAPALQGVGAVFLMRPPHISRMKDTLNAFLDAARTCGVEHVVFLSVAGAENNPLVPHHDVEKHLRQGALGWTILRPGFFSQNLGDAYRRDLSEDHRLFVPAGNGRVAFVDVRDVAEVAALALTNPVHRGQAYTLTGPEAVSFHQVAALLSQALHRPITYQPASVLAYLRHQKRRGLPNAQAGVVTLLHVGLRLGQAQTVDPTLERLLGRPSRTMATYIADHVALWPASGHQTPGSSDF